MNEKFITKDDNWGIREALKEIYFGKKKSKELRRVKKEKTPIAYDPEKEMLGFDIWFNQCVPPPFYATRSAVIRHIDAIKKTISSSDGIWLVRGGQFQSGVSIPNNPILMDQFKKGLIRIPTYYEVQEELNRIQTIGKYNKTHPIKEEYVQLVIKKK